jgi:hypothetical protein
VQALLAVTLRRRAPVEAGELGAFAQQLADRLLHQRVAQARLKAGSDASFSGPQLLPTLSGPTLCCQRSHRRVHLAHLGRGEDALQAHPALAVQVLALVARETHGAQAW